MSHVSAGDDFFSLGGSSTELVHIQQVLEVIIGQEIPTIDLFCLPTIADVTRYLDGQPHSLPATHSIVLAQAEVSQVSAACKNPVL